MPVIAQTIIVACLVAACLAYVAWQAWRVMAGKRSQLGSCCGKGCAAQQEKPKGPQTQFIPAELIGRRKNS